MTRHARLASVILMLCVVGCAAKQAAVDSRSTVSPSRPDVVSIPLAQEDVDVAKSPRGPVDPSLQELIDAAIGDLVQRIGVGSDAVEVLEARRVTWANSALGCPRAGEAYLDVLTDGALIRLRARDKSFQYHSGRGRPPFLCQNPTPPFDSGAA